MISSTFFVGSGMSVVVRALVMVIIITFTPVVSDAPAVLLDNLDSTSVVLAERKKYV